MKPILFSRFGLGLFLLLWIPCALFGGDAYARPVTGRGAEAQTLLLYADTLADYSFSDELEVLSCHLRRVDMKLQTLPVSEARVKEIAAADYLIVFCPRPEPKISEETLQMIFASSKPVLWVGYGAEKCALLRPFVGEFSVSPFSREGGATSISYHGRRWETALQYWIPARLSAAAQENAIIQMKDPKASSGEAAAVDYPVCWKSGNSTFFVSVPFGSGLLDRFFSDMLLDFFGVQQIPPSKVYIRIEDYHCRRNHRDFRRLVDRLYSSGHPFLVAVIPTYDDPATGERFPLRTQPEFVEALRYAQRRGGRLVMHGYTHAYRKESGEGHEFWDVELDQPIPEDSAEYVRRRLDAGVQEMIAQGLFPLAWETPHYAGSRHTYEEVAKTFSTSVERFQLSDATYQWGFEATALTLDRYGRVLLPENLGYVSSFGKLSASRIKLFGDELMALRGTIAGCFFHPYLSFDRFAETLDTLEAFQAPFLDLADVDHWVQGPGLLLLNGKAQRQVHLKKAIVRWRAFDRVGNLLAEERETSPKSGDYVFARKGRGDYELYEFEESAP